MSEGNITEQKRLDSWKEIADYVDRDVRTVMRWEQDGFPVRRIPGGTRRGVFALTEEIDAWLERRESDTLDHVVPHSDHGERRRFWAVAAFLVLIAAICLFLAWQWRATDDQAVKDLILRTPTQKFRFSESMIELQGIAARMAAGDFNRDGKIDIVVGGAPGDRMAILLNGPGFSNPTYHSTCDYSNGPSVGDFDGDGFADVAVTCQERNEVQVWWGEGNGKLSSSTRIPVGLQPVRTDLGDVNGDGLPDLVIDSWGGGPVTVLLSDKTRKFQRKDVWAKAANGPKFADTDGDRKLDIVIGCAAFNCSEVEFFKGRGDGSFGGPVPIAAGILVVDLEIADFTEDGIPDIVACSLDGVMVVIPGLGQGKFGSPREILRRDGGLMLLKFPTARGYSVLITQWAPPRLSLLTFQSDGRFMVSDGPELQTSARLAVVSDLNGDGLPDIAVESFGPAGKSTLKLFYQEHGL